MEQATATTGRKHKHKHRHSKRTSRVAAAPSPADTAPSSATATAATTAAAPETESLHTARDAETVQRLLAADSGARVDALDAAGRTPLHTATLAGRADVAKALLQRADSDAFVNRRAGDGDGCDTALHAAARAGSLPLCALLVAARADPNVKNAAGQTPLHVAAARGSAALVSLLVEHAASVRACDAADRTPLHLAAGADPAETDVVAYLLKHGAQIDAADADGRQPLDYALRRGHEAKCHILQASGADVGLRYRPKERGGAASSSSASSPSPPGSGDPAAAAAQPADASLLDQWGFENAEAANAEAAVPKKAAAKHAKKVRERTAKWVRMMQPQARWERTLKRDMPKLRRRVLKGIPESIRGTAWQLLARSAQRKATFPAGYYQQLLVPNTASGEQIDLDINRCFRAHVMFRERYGPGQQSLWNVLKAYSNYDKEVSYCQGMTEIAALLLMYMAEEDAFWTLVQLLNEPSYALRNMFLTGFPALHTAFHCHTKLVKKFIPRLHEHFEHENISSIYYATKWFMTLFIDVLPWELCLRVWDVLFLEGIHMTHTIALRLLEYQQKELMALPFDQLMFRLTSLKNIKVAKLDEFLVFVTKNRLSESLLATFRLEHTQAVFKENAARSANPSGKGKGRQQDKPSAV